MPANKKYQQGVSLYLAIVILSLMTATLLGFMSILMSQTRIVANLSDSIIAFYATDAGIERMLYEVYQEDWLLNPHNTDDCIFPIGGCTCPGASDNAGDWVKGANVNALKDAEVGYQVCVSSGNDEILWATGDYRGTTRKIEIAFD